MKIYIFLLFLTFVQASPKRPFRAEEIPEAPEEKDNEQEIAFGAFSYYDDEEPEEPQPEEAVESRKRPNFPIFSEGSTFGSSAGNRPTGPPAFVINSQNQDNDEEETETLPYDVIERGYVSTYFIVVLHTGAKIDILSKNSQVKNPIFHKIYIFGILIFHKKGMFLNKKCFCPSV